MSEVVVLGQQPGLQTLLLAEIELPSGVTGPFLNGSVSCTEPGWAELLRPSSDTPQRAAKINLWCFAEIPWLLLMNLSYGRVTVWSHTERPSTG